MNIIINTSSMVPIYEQIMDEIKAQIASGKLQSGEALPSVRALSAELKISALTVKKAYDKLEAEGYTATVHGKGSYVTGVNTEMIADQQRREIEKEFEKTINKAKQYGISSDEISELVNLILEDS
ncbi:MAG: GntR family transcriptional regulator [Lachnospiraceae bacterium]|nr:GntR family transcriptional regulator [Lachnospiraceae bacterium]